LCVVIASVFVVFVVIPGEAPLERRAVRRRGMVLVLMVVQVASSSERTARSRVGISVNGLVGFLGAVPDKWRFHVGEAVAVVAAVLSSVPLVVSQVIRIIPAADVIDRCRSF
jgi:hypothetical protein